MHERGPFYERTLARLLADGVLHREMRVLVVAGGRADRDAFQANGFPDVTITNLEDAAADSDYAPFRWERADAEALDYPDDSFDFGVVSAGLHHCRSPHRALLELYRVARAGLLAIESRDSTLVRAALKIGLVDEYELTAVAANDFRSGGVRNSATPNYVYRWTEREVEKTIATYAPHVRHRFLFFREFEIPSSIVDMRGRTRAGALRALRPVVGAVTRVLPKQANLFAFAVLKPRIPEGLQPWMTVRDDDAVPDESWLRGRFSRG